MFRKPWHNTGTLALRSSLLGGFLVAGRLALWPGWPVAALVLAVFVIVPLSLALAAPREDRGGHRVLWAAVVWTQLPASLAVLTASFLEPGGVAALLALPWLTVTSLAALSGLWRLLRRGLRPVAEVAIDFGLIYLGVGGVWTVLALWGDTSLQSALHGLTHFGDAGTAAAGFGLRALGFPHLIIQLTAVHFHYAGLVLPLLTGLVGRRRPGVESAVATVGVIVGIPLVAVGINLTQIGMPDVEPWAAWLLSASAALTAVLHLWHAGSLPALPRTLLTVAGVCLLLAMALSSLYAWGRFSGLEVVTIAGMLPSHGALNALGFGLMGLLGWLLVENGKSQGGGS